MGLAEHRLLAVADDDGDVPDGRRADAAHPGPRGRRAVRSDRAQSVAVCGLGTGTGTERLDDRPEVGDPERVALRLNCKSAALRSDPAPEPLEVPAHLLALLHRLAQHVAAARIH